MAGGPEYELPMVAESSAVVYKLDKVGPTLTLTLTLTLALTLTLTLTPKLTPTPTLP